MKTVAEFKIAYHQFLDESAQPVQELPDFAKDKNTLHQLYRLMVLTRQFDAKAVALQRTGKMGTYPSALGQEAVSIGFGSAMSDNDVFCPYYRDQGALFARGVTPEEIFTFWGGDERGSHFKKAKEDLPLSVPIATQCLHAAGVAYAFKYRKQKRVAVTSIGEGGTSEGDFYEAMNIAGAWQLPVVFMVNNNQWAISVPRGIQTHCPTIAQKAIAAGFEGIQVDGNDIIAVHELAHQAIEKARKGGGPTLIEAITYRLSDHTTADDASRYVDKDELEKAKQKEPVKRLREYMITQNFWDDEQEEKLQKEIAEIVDAASKNYSKNDEPQPESMLDFLYAELPESLLDQREQLGETHA